MLVPLVSCHDKGFGHPRFMFGKIFGRRRPPKRGVDWKTANEERIARLRSRGVRIGDACHVFTEEFSTEPYLVELGDGVGVAGGTVFLTHDGAAVMLRKERPLIQHFGRIVVERNTFIGQNSILLPGTFIGKNCLIAAGSVVRGEIPDNSFVAGNPGRVIGRASLLLAKMQESPDSFDSLALSQEERRKLLEKHFGLEDAWPKEKA